MAKEEAEADQNRSLRKVVQEALPKGTPLEIRVIAHGGASATEETQRS